MSIYLSDIVNLMLQDLMLSLSVSRLILTFLSGRLTHDLTLKDAEK